MNVDADALRREIEKLREQWRSDAYNHHADRGEWMALTRAADDLAPVLAILDAAERDPASGQEEPSIGPVYHLLCACGAVERLDETVPTRTGRPAHLYRIVP